MKVKIAICDDDRRMVWEVARLISRQAPRAETTTFSDAAMLLQSNEAFDILFLDIQMKGINGLEAARQLREKHPYDDSAPYLLFITAHEGFMPKAFDVGAFHYLVKPLDPDKFAEVFGRVLGLVKYRRKAQKSILLKTEEGDRQRIDVRRIVYVESDNKKVIVQTLDGPLLCTAQMGRLAAELGDGFFRSHRSYLVNLDRVTGYTRDTIQLAGGGTVPMAKKNYAALPAALLRHETGQEGEEKPPVQP